MRAQRISAVAVAAGVGLACILTAQSWGRPATPRLRRLVVVGDSILAGFGNGGLVRRARLGQRDSAPALLARQAGVSLRQPLMSRPGFPPPLVIVDQNGNGQLDPGDVRRRSDGLGFRSQPDREARNLAVPGERVTTVFDTVDFGLVGDIVSGDAAGRDIMKLVILDFPPRDEGVSQVRRAQDLHPSFILLWLGNNDVLGMATRTDPGALQITPAQFGTEYRRLLNALADTGAGMAVANLPDVTGIATLRRAAGEVTSCRTQDGGTQPVAEDDLLSIHLDPSQLPVPPCGRVLDSAEQAFVRGQVTAFNTEIANATVDVGLNRGITIAQVDAFTLFDDLRTQGLDVRGNGSLVLTTHYLGGIFGLDGTHPTKTAHAVIANAFIDAINTQFGEAIPRVDVVQVAARDRFVLNRFRPTGEPPFGLIAGDDAVDDALQNVEDHADDLLDDLRDDFSDLF